MKPDSCLGMIKDGMRFDQKEGSVHVDLWYPRNDGNANSFNVGLMDVRAADDIRVSYDFDRDGWKIEQAAVFDMEVHCDIPYDPDWKEVAFVQAWGRQEEVKLPPGAVALNADFQDGLEYMAAWLVDHVEGEVITEEQLLNWVGEAIKAKGKPKEPLCQPPN